jgi:copper chaperone
MMIVFEVNDMTCGHCVSMITKAVKQTDGAARVEFDLASKRVQIEPATAGEAELKAAIEEAGYSPTSATAAAPSVPQRTGGRGCGCH